MSDQKQPSTLERKIPRKAFELRESQLVKVDDSTVFEDAYQELAEELARFAVDPLLARASADWSRLSHQVVGHECLHPSAD